MSEGVLRGMGVPSTASLGQAEHGEQARGGRGRDHDASLNLGHIGR